MVTVKIWKTDKKMRKYLGKTDKLSYICHGKADKIRPFNIRKGDKDMIKRKIDRYLADFFEANKKALMLTGARQIGKHILSVVSVMNILKDS